mgnify:CR=1 FL=1
MQDTVSSLPLANRCDLQTIYFVVNGLLSPFGVRSGPGATSPPEFICQQYPKRSTPER